MMNKSKFGFTLAEVLITLGIIGIVAAITIPGLITKYRRSVVETKLKKFYSTMNQAIRHSIADNEDIVFPDDLDKNSSEHSDVALKWYKENLTKYIAGAYIEKYRGYDPERYVKCTFNDGSGFVSYIQGTTLWVFYCLDASSPYCRHESYDGEHTFLFVYYPTKKNIDVVGDGKNHSGCFNKNPGHRHVCAAWIKNNGWKIPDNYPWIK